MTQSKMFNDHISRRVLHLLSLALTTLPLGRNHANHKFTAKVRAWLHGTSLKQLLRLRAAFHTSPLFQFTHVRPVKVYVRTHVKITRQWKSTFSCLENIGDSLLSILVSIFSGDTLYPTPRSRLQSRSLTGERNIISDNTHKQYPWPW